MISLPILASVLIHREHLSNRYSEVHFAMISILYKKLSGERKIRLMTLDPGSPKDPITCHLSRVTLNTTLNYDALFYEWKEELGRTNITCGGISLSITRSLATAL
jgi:hypothetical protein